MEIDTEIQRLNQMLRSLPKALKENNWEFLPCQDIQNDYFDELLVRVKKDDVEFVIGHYYFVIREDKITNIKQKYDRYFFDIISPYKSYLMFDSNGFYKNQDKHREEDTKFFNQSGSHKTESSAKDILDAISYDLNNFDRFKKIGLTYFGLENNINLNPEEVNIFRSKFMTKSVFFIEENNLLTISNFRIFTPKNNHEEMMSIELAQQYLQNKKIEF